MPTTKEILSDLPLVRFFIWLDSKIFPPKEISIFERLEAEVEGGE